MAARATGADPKVLAAVIRGAVMPPGVPVMPPWPMEALRTIEVPVLILNGRDDAANQKIDGLLRAIPTARAASVKATTTPRHTSRHFIRP